MSNTSLYSYEKGLDRVLFLCYNKGTNKGVTNNDRKYDERVLMGYVISNVHEDSDKLEGNDDELR